MALSVLRVLPFLFLPFLMSTQVHAAPSLDCTNAFASPSKLWPVNHSYQKIKIKGVVHRKDRIPDIAVQCIRQDEPTNSNGDGNTELDGKGIGDSKAWVRKERQGGGNGRVYHIGFTATDSHGASCQGIVQVGVPKTKKGTAIDDGPAYNSTNNNVDCAGIGNQAPQITSEPVTVATVNSLYSYQVIAVDHENDALTYSLANAPLGMVIDANGLISWTPEAAYVGSNTVDVEVVDAVGNTVFQTFNIEVDDPSQCDMQWSQEEYVKSKFDSIDGWALEGEATNLTPGSHNKLRLTNNTSQSATAFLTRPIQVTNTAGTANNFSAYFEVKMHNTKGFAEADGVGADGVVLVFTPEPIAPGDRGGYIGYNVFEKSVAVELDTWKNAWDKNGNHIGINALGDSKSLKQKKLSTRINDSKWAYVWVDYDAKKKQLQVRYSKSKQRPSSATLKRTMDIPALLDSDSMVVGFSSATGASGQIHDIRKFKFSGVLGSTDACATETLTYTTTPPEQIQAGEQIDYTAVAESTLNDATISYELITSPENVVFDPISGRVQWLSEAPGTFTFEIKATSSYGTVLVQRFELLVTEIPNTAPVAQNQNVELLENAPTSIVLTAIDAELDPLEFTVVSGPLHGDITGTAPNLSYVPFENYSGPDEITFTAFDGMVDSNVAVISINVVDVNSAPVALEQFIPIFENTPVDITLEASDADMDSLSYTVVDEPSNGVLSGTAPNLTYTPNTNFVGSDEFTFSAFDGALESEIAIVEISVSNVNVSPVALSQSVAVEEDSEASFTLTGNDEDGDTLSFLVEGLPVNGQLSGTAPNLIYTPNPDFVGTDALSFRVSDGELESELATVTFVVSNSNDAPIAISQEVELFEDSSVEAVLVATDVDSDGLTFQMDTLPSNGTIDLTGNTYLYSPNPNYFGADEFTFFANDGSLNSDLATVVINVKPVNDRPTISAISVDLVQPNVVTFSVPSADIDGDDLSYVLVNQPVGGILTELDNGVFSFTPSVGFVGLVEVQMYVTDGVLDSEIVTVSINVVLANQAPVFTLSEVDRLKKNVSIDAVFELLVLAEDSDGDPLEYSLDAHPAGMSIDGLSGKISWTPRLEDVGVHEYVVVVEDGRGGSTSINLTIEVLAVELTSSNLGTDFWFMFLRNNSSGAELEYAIHITALEDAVGEIRVAALDLVVPFTVLAGETFVYQFTREQSDIWRTMGQRSDVAINIVSDRFVSIYAHARQDRATDGFLVHPTTALGNSHILSGYGSDNIGVYSSTSSGYSLIGTEDNTTITIIPTYDHEDGTQLTIAGHSFSFNLDKGETYFTVGNGMLPIDMSGTSITSTKPIAVIATQEIAYVPTGNFAADSVIEQVAPISSWGAHYLSAPLAHRENGDLVRVYASKDNTQVWLNGRFWSSINAGEHFEAVVDEPAEIRSNFPIAVAQFSNGNDWDLGEKDGPRTFSDPFMILIPPVEAYVDGVGFSVPGDNFTINWITIITANEYKESVLLDSQLLDISEFKPIGQSGYVFAEVEVQPGSHSVVANGDVNVLVYGFDDYESYGYSAGRKFAANSGDDIQIAISDESSEIYLNLCLDIVVTDVDGVRIPMMPLDAQLVGVNDDSYSVLKIARASLSFAIQVMKPALTS